MSALLEAIGGGGAVCSCKNCRENIDQPQMFDESLPPCKLDHVIYKIHCSLCGLQYVGMTKTKFGQRINQYRHTVKAGNYRQLIHKHFIRDCPSATFENARFTIIDKVSALEEPYPLQKLREKESYWIKELDVLYPSGLNVQPGKKGQQQQQPSSLSTCAGGMSNLVQQSRKSKGNDATKNRRQGMIQQEEEEDDEFEKLKTSFEKLSLSDNKQSVRCKEKSERKREGRNRRRDEKQKNIAAEQILFEHHSSFTTPSQFNFSFSSPPRGMFQPFEFSFVYQDLPEDHQSSSSSSKKKEDVDRRKRRSKKLSSCHHD